MNKGIIALALTALSLSCLDAASGPVELKAMTFNVRWDGLDQGKNAWTNRYPLALAVIKNADADVVGPQEPSREQTHDLETGLENFTAFIGKEERDQHVPLLFRSDRFQLEAAGSFWLVAKSDLDGGTRRCAWIHILDKNSGRGCYVFNVHFDHRSQTSRLESARSLMRGIREREYADPFVVTGDFNEGPKGAALRLLLTGESIANLTEGHPVGQRLVDAFALRQPDQPGLGTGHGFTGRITGTRIDFILVTPHDAVIDAAILHDHEGGLYPSDHFPVTATLRLGSQ